MAKVVTKKKNPVRLSYVNVFKPRQIEGSDPKYSVCIMFPKTDKVLKKIFDDAIKQTAVDDVAKWGRKVPANLKTPIHDGDEERPDRPEFRGMWYFNAVSTRPPQVLDEYKTEMLDPNELYSGCWARVSVNFSGYNNSGNKGIGAYINNIMKLRDDVRLGGTSATAEEDFADDDEDDEDLL
jgi:hypothetical protein